LFGVGPRLLEWALQKRTDRVTLTLCWVVFHKETETLRASSSSLIYHVAAERRVFGFCRSTVVPVL